MGVNSLPKTVTRQRRDCDLNPGRSAPESSTRTTRLPSHALPCKMTDEQQHLKANSHDKTVLSVERPLGRCELDSRQLKTVADRKSEV